MTADKNSDRSIIEFSDAISVAGLSRRLVEANALLREAMLARNTCELELKNRVNMVIQNLLERKAFSCPKFRIEDICFNENTELIIFRLKRLNGGTGSNARPDHSMPNAFLKILTEAGFQHSTIGEDVDIDFCYQISVAPSIIEREDVAPARGVQEGVVAIARKILLKIRDMTSLGQGV